MDNLYLNPGPSRQEINSMSGVTILQFGTEWCGYCQGAAKIIQTALSEAGQFNYLKIEDGPGRILGRSYRIKLWPTLVFLKDGNEIGRVVRPESVEVIKNELLKLLN